MLYMIAILGIGLILVALKILSAPSVSLKKGKELRTKLNKTEETEGLSEIMQRWSLLKKRAVTLKKSALLPIVAIFILAYTDFAKELGPERFLIMIAVPLSLLTASLFAAGCNIKRCPKCKFLIGSCRLSFIDTKEYVKYYSDPINCPNCKIKLRET